MTLLIAPGRVFVAIVMLLRHLLAVAVVAFLMGAVATDTPWAEESAPSRPNPFQEELDQIVSLPCAKRAGVGVKVVSLARGDVLGEYQSTRALVPASNTKLLTTAAALHFLHPDYRFVTRLFADGTLVAGRVEGNLYVMGSGDPFLVSEEAWRLASEVRNAGVAIVTGDLVADDSFFDEVARGRGWPANPGPKPYLAPINALSLNFNVVTVYVHPGSRMGEPVRVIIDPPTSYVSVQNLARTGRPSSRSTILVDRRRRSDSEEIIVRGQIPAGSGRERHFVGINNPPLYTATVLKEMLARLGVEVKGRARVGRTPAGAWPVAEHESRSLAEVVLGMNKFSNNFMAEQILKTVGAEVYGPPGTWEKGIKAVEDYLGMISLGRSSFTIADGSGLSRFNRLSADLLVRVLDHVYKDFHVLPEFLASLSIMGADGSLHNRLQKTEAIREIRAKTGTLSGVSSLSGYARTQDGELLAFAIIVNELSCNSLSALALQNRIVLAMVQFTRTW